MARRALGLTLTIITAIALVPRAAGAQAATADGIQAIVRADYQSAVRILRPLAEETPDADPLAQFFMAMLYDSGHGVTRNWERACGLYLNAATPANPLMSQSLDLARRIQQQFGGAAAPFCEAARAVRSRPAPPATLTLAPDHTVTIDESGMTVRYRGAEKHAGTAAAAGLVALPIRHTPLDVSRPVEMRRHFIQSFMWMPNRSSDPPTWTLGWILNEVAGIDLFMVAGERVLASVTAPTPPTDIDVGELARVGVNSNGEAEWVVSGEANPRGGVVPTRGAPPVRAPTPAAILPRLAPPSVDAQPATAEGVDAFVRGDYQRAAEILKPIAEGSPQPNFVAAYLMAALYDIGGGVTADAMRACALYQRASYPRGPFGSQAMALIESRRQTLGREAFEECNWRAGVGFDHGFEPVTFALGPGHWIAWDVRGATIAYDGKEKRVQLALASRLATILPLRHTELAAGPTRSTPRHFIEILTWLPRQPQTWTLMWMLKEVVRDELIEIATEQLATVSAPEPPVERSFDVRNMVRLRVNDDGHAEWSLLGGSHPRTTVIDTEVDRQEREEERQRQRARVTVDARVDWSRVVDVNRQPALAYVDAGICGHGMAYGWSGDRTEAIALLGEDLSDLAATARTFDLADGSNGFEVRLHLAAQPLRSWPFCSDVREPWGGRGNVARHQGLRHHRGLAARCRWALGTLSRDDSTRRRRVRERCRRARDAGASDSAHRDGCDAALVRFSLQATDPCTDIRTSPVRTTQPTCLRPVSL